MLFGKFETFGLVSRIVTVVSALLTVATARTPPAGFLDHFGFFGFNKTSFHRKVGSLFKVGVVLAVGFASLFGFTAPRHLAGFD